MSVYEDPRLTLITSATDLSNARSITLYSASSGRSVPVAPVERRLVNGVVLTSVVPTDWATMSDVEVVLRDERVTIVIDDAEYNVVRGVRTVPNGISFLVGAQAVVTGDIAVPRAVVGPGVVISGSGATCVAVDVDHVVPKRGVVLGRLPSKMSRHAIVDAVGLGAEVVLKTVGVGQDVVVGSVAAEPGEVVIAVHVTGAPVISGPAVLRSASSDVVVAVEIVDVQTVPRVSDVALVRVVPAVGVPAVDVEAVVSHRGLEVGQDGERFEVVDDLVSSDSFEVLMVVVPATSAVGVHVGPATLVGVDTGVSVPIRVDSVDVGEHCFRVGWSVAGGVADVDALVGETVVLVQAGVVQTVVDGVVVDRQSLARKGVVTVPAVVHGGLQVGPALLRGRSNPSVVEVNVVETYSVSGVHLVTVVPLTRMGADSRLEQERGLLVLQQGGNVHSVVTHSVVNHAAAKVLIIDSRVGPPDHTEEEGGQCFVETDLH